MGNNFITKQISPSLKISSEPELPSESQEQISRANFKFVEKISTTGYDDESILWIAHNKNNKNEKFYIKESNKKLLYDHNRIESLQNELNLLIREESKFIVRPLYAFQDYHSLYLVFQYIDGFTLEEVLKEHLFTEEEAKYVIVTLINIIEHFHQQKFAISELCPKNLIVEKKSGYLKLFQLINPISIDSSFPSNIITNLNPYCAPEIIAMDEVRTQSDFYSLGLILYQIMKQKRAIPQQIAQDRNSIINEEIQVVKSDLPEGWKPEAADFLVKLLIKNPQLRLGKYGSFEVRTHPWLQNCTWTNNYNWSSIHLNDPYFEENSRENLSKREKELKEGLINEYGFQSLFEGYSYCIAESKNEESEYDSIQEQF